MRHARPEDRDQYTYSRRTLITPIRPKLSAASPLLGCSARILVRYLSAGGTPTYRVCISPLNSQSVSGADLQTAQNVPTTETARIVQVPFRDILDFVAPLELERFENEQFREEIAAEEAAREAARKAAEEEEEKARTISTNASPKNQMGSRQTKNSLRSSYLARGDVAGPENDESGEMLQPSIENDGGVGTLWSHRTPFKAPSDEPSAHTREHSSASSSKFRKAVLAEVRIPSASPSRAQVLKDRNSSPISQASNSSRSPWVVIDVPNRALKRQRSPGTESSDQPQSRASSFNRKAKEVYRQSAGSSTGEDLDVDGEQPVSTEPTQVKKLKRYMHRETKFE